MTAQERPVAGDGLDRIAAERRRQVEVEGWTPEHDASLHDSGELVLAARCYAAAALSPRRHSRPPTTWPWNKARWKPSPDPIRTLEKAGALIAAEIDRLLRARSGGEA